MFVLDSLTISSIVLMLLLAAITAAASPRRMLSGQGSAVSLLLVVAGSAVAYSAASPWLFLAGWIITAAPLWLQRKTYGLPVCLVHAASAAALAAAFLLSSHPTVAFALLAGAIILRKGLFPFHFWVPAAFEQGSLPYLNLLLNSHLGAYLMIRFAVPLYPELASSTLPLLGLMAIFTSIYGAVLALGARKPRRILALLSTSQAAFILAGIQNRNVEGITGALLFWWVVALATTGLVVTYQCLEARTVEAESPDGFLGLGFHAPRLAVFFAVSALALAGLPGTLGFVAEDLLFHGSLESHHALGAALPLATALNAITVLSLFATLFLGRRGLHVPVIPDALPRERWALSLPVVLLVAGGLLPAAVIGLRISAATHLAHLLER